MACEHHSLVIINEQYPRKLLQCEKRESSSLRWGGERLISKSTFCSLLAKAQRYLLESLLWTEPKPHKLYQDI